MKPNRQRTNGQHTVARNYLSRFLADGRNCLFVFDKETQTIFDNSPFKTSVENNFYDLPPDYSKLNFPHPNHDHQFLEHALAKVDGKFKVDLDAFLKDAPTKGITRNDRVTLAPHVVIQWLRGKEFRETVYQVKVRFTKAYAEEVCKRKHPDIPIEVSIAYDKDAIDQTIQLLDDSTVTDLATWLMNQIWILGTNSTMQLLYTSDNPVAKKAHLAMEGMGLTAFKAPGIEIVYPLDSHHALMIYERRHHGKTHQKWENQPLRLVPPTVLHFNEMQVHSSYRHVYCGRNQFEQAQGYCKRFTEICKSNRDRVSVAVDDKGIATLHVHG